MQKIILLGFISLSSVLWSSESIQVIDTTSQEFFVAAQTGDISKIKLLSTDSVGVNRPDAQGYTPLHWAAYNGFVDVVKILLEHGAHRDTQDGNTTKSTPLQIAILRDHSDVIKLLLSQGANLQVRDIGGATALRCAFNSHRPSAKLLKTLHACGARVAELEDTEGRPSPLTIAAATGSLAGLRWMLTHREIAHVSGVLNLCTLDVKNQALATAVRFNQKSAAELLLIQNANPETIIAHTQLRLLHHAIVFDYGELVDVLLTHGACKEAEDAQGMKPLALAASLDRTSSVASLLRCGAQIEGRSTDGRTALFFAAAHGHGDCVQALLDRGAAVNVQDDSGKTALHCALLQDTNPAIMLLLDHGARTDIQDRTGTSPLRLALQKGVQDTIDLTIRSFLKSTLSSIARTHSDIRSLLITALTRSMNAGLPSNAFAVSEPHFVEHTYGHLIDEVIAQTQRVQEPVSHLTHQASSLLDPSAKKVIQSDKTNDGQQKTVSTTSEWLAVKKRIETNARKFCSTMFDAAACDFDPEVSRGIQGREHEFVQCLLAHGITIELEFNSMRLLEMALYARNEALAETLLDEGADCNAQSYDGSTMLHAAAKVASGSLMKLLLGRGADPDVKNEEGRTPFAEIFFWLHEGNYAEDVDLGPCIELLSESAMADEEIVDGLTPLMIAPQFNIPLIEKCKANVNYRNAQGRTALHEAIAGPSSNLKFAVSLIKHGADVNAQDKDGRTPLHEAATLIPTYANIKQLVAAEADLNRKDKDNKTVIDHLIEQRLDGIRWPDDYFLEDTVVDLLCRGALLPDSFSLIDMEILAEELLVLESVLESVRLPQAALDRALFIAVAFNSPQGIDLLIHNGANKAFVVNKRSLLQSAAQLRNPEAVKALLKAGTNIEYKTEEFGTPLLLASKVGSAESAEILLDYKADTETRDSAGYTPLHLARSANTMKVLLDRGARINSRSSATQMTPLLAVMKQLSGYELTQKVNCLLQYGAHIDAEDSEKDTPLSTAITCFLWENIPEILIKQCFWCYVPTMREFKESSARVFEVIRVLGGHDSNGECFTFSPYVIASILLSDESTADRATGKKRGITNDVICMFMHLLGKKALFPALELSQLNSYQNPKQDPYTTLRKLVTIFQLIKDAREFGAIGYLLERLQPLLQKTRTRLGALEEQKRIYALKRLDGIESKLGDIIKEGLDARYNVLKQAAKDQTKNALAEQELMASGTDGPSAKKRKIDNDRILPDGSTEL